MARALARGWGDPVLCSDSGSGRAQRLADELGGEALSNVEVAERADLVVLCHKPAQLEAVASELRGRVKAVASVLGATTIADLERAYGEKTPVFSMIPNTPVEVRRGVICYAPAPDVDPRLEADVIALFERLGTVVSVPERLMGAATAVSGVGPAYLALVAEAQIDAAVRHGLTAPLAGKLASDSMAGTAELLARRDYDTLAVRREVTSPGGSTARGLEALERGGVRAAFQTATDAVIWGDKR
jgi:pyrroline-5-carboxylate reductase